MSFWAAVSVSQKYIYDGEVVSCNCILQLPLSDDLPELAATRSASSPNHRGPLPRKTIVKQQALILKKNHDMTCHFEAHIAIFLGLMLPSNILARLIFETPHSYK